jgi:AraC-like DNA-binding protein
MDKWHFSTDQLPRELDDRQRFLHWRDGAEGAAGVFDVTPTPDRRFAIRAAGFHFATTMLIQHDGMIRRLGTARNMLSFVGTDSLALRMNLGGVSMGFSQLGRDMVLEPGTSALFELSGRPEVWTDGELHYAGLYVPRRVLRELVADVDDVLATPLDPRLPAMRFLKRYLQIVSDPDDSGHDPSLIAQVDTTVVDLLALALGAGRDATEIARMRGVRAARAQVILAEIRAGFADPEFSARSVAKKLAMSPRYVQDLLQESGLSFTERVLELRLQKARTVLLMVRHDGLRISEVACACGFNEVSYFNRRFRQRFGDAPSAFRGRRIEGRGLGGAAREP